jgi:hypothetical protein
MDKLILVTFHIREFQEKCQAISIFIDRTILPKTLHKSIILFLHLSKYGCEHLPWLPWFTFFGGILHDVITNQDTPDNSDGISTIHKGQK